MAGCGWTAINDALSPLASFTDVMSGGNYVTGSAVIPIIDLLTTDILKENDDDKPLTNDLRGAILNDLLQRNTDSKVVKLLELASFLDPRFKAKYVTDEECIMEKIRIDGVQIHKDSSANLQESRQTDEKPPPLVKKKRTLGSLL